MAYFWSSPLLGGVSWICGGGENNLSSFCLQRTIIDAINLMFFCVFCLFLVFGRKHDSIDTKRKDCVLVVASIFCSVTSIIYFCFGLYDFINHNGKLDNSSLVPCIIRGLIWIFLAISLQFQRSKKWIIYLNSIWWVCLCALLSALNIEHLLKVHTIFVLDFFPWLVSFILLLSAFRNHGFFVSKLSQDYDTMFDPLLFPETEKVEISIIGLSQAKFLSRLTFSWINPLLSLGYKKPLSLENIPPLPSEDRAEVSYKKFAIVWDSLLTERNSNSPNKNLVILALIRVFWKENVYIAVNALARSVSASVSPLIIFAFVNYANREEDNLCEGLSILMCLVVAKLVECWCQRHWNFDARRSGMRMRSAAMVAVYHKLLKVSSLGRRRHSNGEIVNYIAVDAYRFGEFLWWFHTGWSLALQVILGICVLYYVVGISALPGLVLLLMFGFCNVPYANKIKNCQSQILFSQDQRLRLTSEILNNIKIIKLQSWEDKFKSLLELLRDSEFKWLAEAHFTKAIGAVLWFFSPTIICAVVLLGCVFFGTTSLDAATIFTVLATLRTMSEPVKLIPEALSVISQVKISCDRLNSFLLDHELKTDEKRSVLMMPEPDKCIEIEAGCFSWDEESLNLNLRDINLDIKKGQKVAICGSVGAGKSSLLLAILGEMPKVSGAVNLYGRVAYVSQTSWIQSGTIRDNILFGKPMEGDRYENAIKSCALDKDINAFSHGDLTEIGQRGLNLSGGQKQRVQLARAVYNDADIYLLDDPFSAVDAHTAAVLFHDCVMSALRDKTVILVTHQVEFLTEVRKILVMEGGCISQAGSHEELLTLGTTFEQLMNAHKDAITVFGAFHQNQQDSHHQVPNGVNNKTEEKNKSTGEICEANFEEKQLTEEEQRESGSGGWKVFIDYIVISKGKMLLCYCLVSLIVFSLLLAASSYWLAIASDIPSINSVMLVGVYTLLSLSSAIIVYIRSLFVAHLGLKASKAFFSGFTSAIFYAPMSFFDSTPVGRILTRASSDLSTMDVDMPFGLIYAAQSGFELLTGITIMTSVTWEVLIVAILTLLAANYLQGYYQACARELVRINGTTKAPVMNYTTETSAGVVTVRAFKMMDTFFQTFLNLVDTDASLFLYTNAAMEWLLLRIELLQTLILFTAASFFVFLPKGSIAPGFVGLSLAYALSLTRSQIFFTQWCCQLSNFMVSIERIKQFMEIPQEPPKILEHKRPPSSWPFKGRIDFQDLKVRYRANGPFVLDGIRCSLREGTRVGVVGRTGSGKTTLVSALFRLVEPTSGHILIDGLNICSIGLKDLRMNLSIIPQDPILFRGSVRTNLDPLHQFSDHEIWKVLEMCQLKKVISELPYLLDSSVSDEGENWSVGQRQLFCLGRVLLKKNKILVMDEATASIDSATDAILQRLIRHQFSECTVITVAHRVPTVIDSDMVMLLSYGKLVEYDEPSKLMEANSSSFAKLVAEYWSSCRRSSF